MLDLFGNPVPDPPAPAPPPRFSRDDRRAAYTGPFPRKKHYHRCLGCARRYGSNGVHYYKAHCSRPVLEDVCSHCREVKN